ncbi:MAG: hypothetical protein LBB30_02210 [Candidatus Methanoplasma sp.]|jgi:hypothetical protein|nr:hypothetical protein [Candidatus Methanoplasma sp.]
MNERTGPDDPNAGLFGMDEEDISEEALVNKQLYEKNPRRVSALNDLCYDAMISEVDNMDIPEEAKRKLIFKLTANSVLDLICDSAPVDLGLDVSFYFDMYLGVSLANKRFKADLFKEHKKALLGVKADDFPDDEAYGRALEEFEEQWWDIPQPLLEKRTPNDAIKETLAKYGLTE